VGVLTWLFATFVSELCVRARVKRFFKFFANFKFFGLLVCGGMRAPNSLDRCLRHLSGKKNAQAKLKAKLS
jgi:hypothetical protein